MRTILYFLKRKKRLLVGMAFIVLPVAVYGWYRMGYATSPYEVLFMVRLQAASNRNNEDIQLANAMPGEWEAICFSGAYGRDLTIRRFNKKYVARAFPNDDSWDLFFIASDGTHRAASGTCSSTGITVNPVHSRCVMRSGARLVMSSETTRTCSSYTLIGTTWDERK